MARAITFISTAIMLFVLVIGLSGCGPGNQTSDYTSFRGGDTGLQLSFVEGAPPDAVYDAGQLPFTIALRVTNAGESNVGYLDTYFQNPNDPYPDVFGQFRIVGLLPVSWGNPPPQIIKEFSTENFGLRGARKHGEGDVIEGDTQQVQFTGFNYQEDIVGASTVPLRAEVCYDYTTHSIGQLCFMDSLLQSSDAVCNVNREVVPQNSGAPVHVTSMKQNGMGQSTVSVQFVVEHVGTGMVFARDNPALFPEYAYSNPLGQPFIPCDTNPAAQRNKDKVHVRVHFSNPQLDDSLIRCSNFNGYNQGVVTLLQGTPVPVMCQIQIPQGYDTKGGFEQIVNVELKYRYLESIQRDLVIKDLTIA